MKFEELDKLRKNEQTFEQKVEMMTKRLNLIKSIVQQKRILDKDLPVDESNTNILSQIDSMLQKVNSIQSESNKSENLYDENSLKPVLNAVSNLKNSKSSPPNVTYELMYNKNSNNILVAAKLSELKKRLDVIEKCIGSWDRKKHGTIGELLRNTEDKLKIITDERSMNVIRKRSSAMFSNMFNIQEAKATDDIRYDTKALTEISDIVKDTQEDIVHQDVERLESLRSLHEQSANVVNKIKQIQMTQGKILEGIKDDQTAIANIQQSFTENIDIMKQNLQNIKERISKLG